MRRLTIPEVLQSLEDKSSEERIEILRQNNSISLRQILFLSYNPNLEFVLPDTRPDLKLKETPTGISRNSLFHQSRKLKMFIKGFGYDGLTNLKRETLFIQILESLHADESELLLQIMIDRDLQSSLTREDVDSAFPGLLPEKIEKETKPEPVVEKEPEPVVEKEPEPVVEKEPEPVVEEESSKVEEESDLEELNKEEPEVYKNLTEVYEKNNKKSKTKKKSSKKSK